MLKSTTHFSILRVHVPLLALAFSASCSPNDVMVTADGPTFTLSAEQPVASFEVEFCAKKSARGNTFVSGMLHIEELQSSAAETSASVLVTVDEGEEDAKEREVTATDERWSRSLEFNSTGPWDDNKRGCGRTHSVTIALVDHEPSEPIEVFWSIDMHVSSFATVKRERRGWHEDDFEIAVSAL